MQLITEEKVATAGNNVIEVAFSVSPAEAHHIVAFELQEFDATTLIGLPDFGNVYIYIAGQQSISLNAGWLEAGKLFWSGDIPLHSPFILHAELYNAPAGAKMRFNYALLAKWESEHA